jgi:hypothetical protein
MQMIAIFGLVAVVLGSALPPPLPMRPEPGPERVLRINTGAVADFSRIEYFPNLKSKIGLAANIRRQELADAGRFIDELGPGLMCSNIEFDHWYKWPGEPIEALSQDFSVPGDETSRPTELQDRPAQWLTDYQRMIGERNVAQLFQLTGAPAQFQVAEAKKPAIHPAPTDIAGAAALMGAWTAADRHPYPVLWSLWNEPNHTLVAWDGERAGEPAAETAAETAADDATKTKEERKAERKAERKEARKEERRAEKAKDGKDGKPKAEKVKTPRDALDDVLDESAAVIAGLFASYSAEMRPRLHPYSRFGLASFIASNFHAEKVTGDGGIYFEEVVHKLRPGLAGAPVDFLTFNSFNGGWSVILNGVRAVMGADKSFGMIIFTQYAPQILKTNEGGEPTKRAGTDATPMQAAVAMLQDLAQLQRATDVQHVCLSYWIGGPYGLLQAKEGTLAPAPRYQALRMFMELPVLRTRLDLGGLEAEGIGGLAGLDAARAAVLLWNGSDRTVEVPLTLTGLPDGHQKGTVRVSVLADGQAAASEQDLAGGLVAVPAHGVALVEVAAPGAADPLKRRHSLQAGGDSPRPRFLQTTSFPDRVADQCARGRSLPGVNGCGRNTGTFGFYDGVRSVGYLGQGKGGGEPRVTVVYDRLPDQVYVTANRFGPEGSVTVTADFPACGETRLAEPMAGADTLLLDLAGVPADCRAAAAGGRLSLTLSGAAPGTQAEVYLSANPDEAADLAAFSPLVSATPSDTDENLAFSPLKAFD